MFELLFVKGGWIMVLIMALSVYALSIIFFKIYQFRKGAVLNTRFMDAAMARIKQGELTEAATMLAREKGPVARIMRVSIECLMNREMSMKSRESEIARVGTAEIRYLESHMRGLEMTYTLSPLVGLMGTVIGMINAFTRLSEAGSRIDPSMLAGGIWEALINTAGGLAVAVPSLAAYYLLDSMIERTRATMRDVTVQILALEDAFKRNEKEQDRRTRMEEEARQRSLFEKLEQQLAPAPAMPVTPEVVQPTPQPMPAPVVPETVPPAPAVKAAPVPEPVKEEITESHEEEEKILGPRGSPISTSTLRLLSPSYKKF